MRMKRSAILLSAAVATALVFTSCNGSGNREPAVSDEITISGLEDGKWTYFSVESGEVVGTSTFLSDEEDALWAKRGDWDFAICGDYLKTNGGTSGEGAGAIQRDESHNFTTLKEAPDEGYLTDEVGIVR